MLAKRLSLLTIAVIAFAVVALTGVGNLLQGTDPSRALAYNPYDADARVKWMEEAIEPGNEVPLADVERVARDSIRFTPIHAPSYSVLAEVQQRRGNPTRANATFAAALSLAKTESRALQRTLQSALAGGDVPGAIEKLDILFRRWPRDFDSFASEIPLLAANRTGYQLLQETLRTDPPWRDRLMSFLNRSHETVGLAYRLQLALNDDGTRPQETARTQQALIRNGEFEQAYRLFLFTRDQNDQFHAGYVFNSTFALEPSGRPFDWTIRRTPGVNILREPYDDEGQPDYRLRVQFLGKPVRNIGLSQSVFLPRGAYRLQADISAENLEAPRGLYFNLTCVDPREQLARLDIPDGTYGTRVIEADVTLPDRSCRMLKLEVRTDLIAESFRYGYSGSLFLHRVSIIRNT